jgi:hypothetical protein
MGIEWALGESDASTPKATGRLVRDLNNESGDAVAAAKRHVLQAMGEPDSDRRAVLLAKALQELETASVRCRDVEDICRAAAKRGPYRKED